MCVLCVCVSLPLFATAVRLPAPTPAPGRVALDAVTQAEALVYQRARSLSQRRGGRTDGPAERLRHTETQTDRERSPWSLIYRSYRRPRRGEQRVPATATAKALAGRAGKVLCSYLPSPGYNPTRHALLFPSLPPPSVSPSQARNKQQGHQKKKTLSF